MILVCLFQPFEVPGLVSKGHVDECDVPWRHIALLRCGHQFSQRLVRLGSLARHGISVPERGERPRVTSRETPGLLALRNGLLMPSHLLVSQTKEPMRA